MSLRRAIPLLRPIFVLALALAVRLEPWSLVYGSDRVMLTGDSDAHYHVLRTERWLMDAPGAPWSDPALDWPRGADVPWPPGFDALLAAAARVTGGTAVERDAIAAATAPIPVLLGILFVALVAAIGRRVLGPGTGWGAAFLVAALPAGAIESRLGRVDQHALEQVLFCAILLAIIAVVGCTRRTIAGAVALAVVVPVAFWSWMGSAVDLLVLVATVSAAWVLLPERAETRSAAVALAFGSFGAAAALTVSVLALGRPGAIQGAPTTGVGGLQVAMTACVGGYATLLLAARRLRRAEASAAWRLAEVASAATVCGFLLLSSETLRAGIGVGLNALAAGNAWYANIQEFQPLVNLGKARLTTELMNVTLGLGLVPLAAAIGIPPLCRAWRDEPERRLDLLVLFTAAALFVPAWLFRRRFGSYALVPLAIIAEAGVRSIQAVASAGLPRRWRIAPAIVLIALYAAVVAPTFPEHLASEIPVVSTDARQALDWLSRQRVAAGREAVLAPWSYGHALQYYANRPVITSPFGTEGGATAMQDEATFWFSTDELRGETLLRNRRCGYVLLTDIVPESVTLHGFAPPGTPPPMRIANDLVEGLHVMDEPSFWHLLPVRLYYDDGSASDRSGALGGFRLVYETPRREPEGSPKARHWMTFQLVEGAVVEVSNAAGRTVSASTEFETNVGRRATWRAEAPANGRGLASLRLPYASGWNGAVYAREWSVSDGTQLVKFVVHEEDVAAGRHIAIDLATGRTTR